jgi:hypothetical protein
MGEIIPNADIDLFHDLEFVFDIQEVSGKRIVELYIKQLKERLNAAGINHRIQILTTKEPHNQLSDKMEESELDSSVSEPTQTFPYNIFHGILGKFKSTKQEKNVERKTIFDSLFSTYQNKTSPAEHSANVSELEEENMVSSEDKQFVENINIPVDTNGIIELLVILVGMKMDGQILLKFGKYELEQLLTRYETGNLRKELLV